MLKMTTQIIDYKILESQNQDSINRSGCFSVELIPNRLSVREVELHVDIARSTVHVVTIFKGIASHEEKKIYHTLYGSLGFQSIEDKVNEILKHYKIK